MEGLKAKLPELSNQKVIQPSHLSCQLPLENRFVFVPFRSCSCRRRGILAHILADADGIALLRAGGLTVSGRAKMVETKIWVN